MKRRRIDDHIAWEYTVEILEAAGIKPLPRPKGRPPIADDWWHKLDIAKACLAREDRGESVKSAVIATAKAFGVSTSAVYAARKIILPSK